MDCSDVWRARRGSGRRSRSDPTPGRNLGPTQGHPVHSEATRRQRGRNNVPFGIAEFRVLSHLITVLFQGQAGACAVDISGNGLEILPEGSVGRRKSPAILLGPEISNGIPAREQSGGRRRANVDGQPTPSNFAKEVGKQNTQLINEISMNPFRLQGGPGNLFANPFPSLGRLADINASQRQVVLRLIGKRRIFEGLAKSPGAMPDR